MINNLCITSCGALFMSNKYSDKFADILMIIYVKWAIESVVEADAMNMPSIIARFSRYFIFVDIRRSPCLK